MANVGFGKGQRRPVTCEEMRAHARGLLERADRLMDAAWGRMTSVPSSVVTGSSNYNKNFGKKNARNIASFEGAGEKAKALRQAAAKWKSRADAIDPEVLAKKAKQAELKASAKA